MSEENKKMEKIQKSSRAALIVSNISKIFMIMGAVICLAGGCLIFKFEGEINKQIANAAGSDGMSGFNEEIKIRKLERIAGEAVIEEGEAAKALCIYLFTTAVTLVCMAVVFHFVAKTFKDIQESYSPFCPQILKNLKISFVLITILALTSSVLIGLLIGLAGWCVIHIFEYGGELQKQSDETL